jgi:hypothetical protein
MTPHLTSKNGASCVLVIEVVGNVAGVTFLLGYVCSLGKTAALSACFQPLLAVLTTPASRYSKHFGTLQALLHLCRQLNGMLTYGVVWPNLFQPTHVVDVCWREITQMAHQAPSKQVI